MVSLWRLSWSRFILFSFPLNDSNGRIYAINADAMARSHRDFYPLLTCSLMCRCTLAPCRSGTAGSRATLNTIWSSVLGGGLWKGSCIQRSLCHPGLAVIMTTTVSPSQLCLTGILKEQQNRNAYQPEALDATLPVARELVVSLKYNDID